jgi:3',5'-cyclic AMP phosphodiesterase CpdA
MTQVVRSVPTRRAHDRARERYASARRQSPLGGRFDTAANLHATLSAVERTGVRPDAIVFTGDLTDLGEPEAYAALRQSVEPVAERLGAPVVWVAGNHDERPALRAGLFDAEPTQDPVTGVHDLGDCD